MSSSNYYLENIVLSQSGRPYIIDFETAIRVEDGIRWGSTEFFEAPEVGVVHLCYIYFVGISRWCVGEFLASQCVACMACQK